MTIIKLIIFIILGKSLDALRMKLIKLIFDYVILMKASTY